MRNPDRLSPWLIEAGLDYYVRDFERTGFRAGLNRYRNMDRDREQLAHLAGAQVEQPALMIADERDGVIRSVGMEGMKADVPNLRDIVILPGCGHWTQQERPKDVNSALVEFLEGLHYLTAETDVRRSEAPTGDRVQRCLPAPTLCRAQQRARGSRCLSFRNSMRPAS